MIKIPAVGAVAIMLSFLGIPHAQAWCDEDCVYEAYEAAEEREAQRADAREEAAEAGYYVPDRRSTDRSSKSARNSTRSRDSDRSAAREHEVAKRVGEPAREPTPSVDKRRSPTNVASENSSITTETTRIATDDGGGRVEREVGCKTFFPSVGMTVSVPCD
ncbi:MAG: hypothetical protein WC829_04800 [Hyphomicrobium sp.]|jgi:hypothetical protein